MEQIQSTLTTKEESQDELTIQMRYSNGPTPQRTYHISLVGNETELTVGYLKDKSNSYIVALKATATRTNLKNTPYSIRLRSEKREEQAAKYNASYKMKNEETINIGRYLQATQDHNMKKSKNEKPQSNDQTNIKYTGNMKYIYESHGDKHFKGHYNKANGTQWETTTHSKKKINQAIEKHIKEYEEQMWNASTDNTGNWYLQCETTDAKSAWYKANDNKTYTNCAYIQATLSKLENSIEYHGYGVQRLLTGVKASTSLNGENEIPNYDGKIVLD